MVVFQVVFLKNVVLGSVCGRKACEEYEKALGFWCVGVEVVEKMGNGRKGRSGTKGKLTVVDTSFVCLIYIV